MIESLTAREVLDSRGCPTVEVEVRARGGSVGRAIAPAGLSPGRFEARERRDGDGARFGGRGVRSAVELVAAEVVPALAGMDPEDQPTVDAALVALDGTPDRSRLGGNTLLATSLAVARAAAAARGEEPYVHLHCLWRASQGPDDPPNSAPVLPLPLVSMIAGGLHDGRGPDFQDFLLVPLAARSYPEALEMAAVVRRRVADVLRDYAEEADLVTDGGAFGPDLRANGLGVQRILEAIVAAGLRPGVDAAVAIDLNAGRLFDPATGRYRLPAEGDTLDAGGIALLLEHWTREFPVASIEDALAEDDWEGWAALTARLGDRAQVAGGDLFATRADRIREGAARGAANAVVVKPSQVGTLTDTFEALRVARRAGYRTILAARTAETEDTTLADLAVATGCGQVKLGALARSERTAKYNRLLRIAEHLGGPAAPYAGPAALAP